MCVQVFKTSKGAPDIILKLCHNKEEIGKQVDELVRTLTCPSLLELVTALDMSA